MERQERGWCLHSLTEQVDSAVMGALATILSHDEVALAFDMLDHEDRIRLLTNLMSATITTRDRDAATMLFLGGAGTISASVQTITEEEDEP